MKGGNPLVRKKQSNYKSGLERQAAKLLPNWVQYEADKIKYTVVHTYHPDWKIRDNLYIETKGKFTAADRAKHLHIKQQHPEVTVHFLFSKPFNKLNKASSTTYADWCEKHGFEWADIKDGIPKDWLK